MVIYKYKKPYIQTIDELINFLTTDDRIKDNEVCQAVIPKLQEWKKNEYSNFSNNIKKPYTLYYFFVTELIYCLNYLEYLLGGEKHFVYPSITFTSGEPKTFQLLEDMFPNDIDFHPYYGVKEKFDIDDKTFFWVNIYINDQKRYLLLRFNEIEYFNEYNDFAFTTIKKQFPYLYYHEIQKANTPTHFSTIPYTQLPPEYLPVPVSSRRGAASPPPSDT